MNTTDRVEFQNLANYNMNFEIGSSHWFRTLMSQVMRIGTFMFQNSNPVLTKELQKEYGEILYNIAKDMMAWQQSTTPTIQLEEGELERMASDIWCNTPTDEMSHNTFILACKLGIEAGFKAKAAYQQRSSEPGEKEKA